MTETKTASAPVLQTLPGDDIRQIQWRFSERFDIQMLIQSARSVARGPVARLVAAGARNTHEWTAEKNSLLKAYDDSGITAAFLDPEHGGLFAGPKNLAMALVAFELAWVDGGAATASLAGNLGLAPIHECGTPEQVAKYMSQAAPAKDGENRKTLRAAFALTEPLPYVGVETGLLCGKVRVAEWKEGQEPILEVEKRGRFITNMDYANLVTAAVDTDDKRIKSSCMVILEEADPGVFDRGDRHQETGAPAFLHPGPHFPDEGSGIPHRGRLYREGRGHRPQLQPRRGHRGGFQAHPRDRGAHDRRQAALRRGTGDPLPPPALPGRGHRQPGNAAF